MRAFRLTVVVAMLATVAGAGEPVRLAGIPLPQALAELQRRGLLVVYSSGVVRPDMIVQAAPVATSPREVLDEILAPHGLRVREGPGGVLVIVPVRASSVRARSSEPEPARFLEEMVVTPSHVRLLRNDPEPRLFLSRTDVERMPHAADDVYRAVKHLPGTAGSDFSAEFNLRGGDSDEVLVMLDGLELFAPFHLKDFFNAFSSLDSQAIGAVDLLTGGFPAEFGDRMSGVMDIAVRTPQAGHATTVEVGTINSRLLTSGTGSDGSHWLFSARAWYPDDTLDMADAFAEDIATDYYDLLGKYQQQAGARSVIAANILSSRDEIAFHSADDEESERVESRYGSDNIWMNLFTQWTDSLSSVVMAGVGRGEEDRKGGVVDLIEGTLDVADRREFDFVELKQDWRFTLSDRQFLKVGADIRRTRADYDYRRSSTLEQEPEEFHTILKRAGESYGAYVADRFALGRLVTEVGLRWDKQFWTDDNQLSPRINFMFLAGPRTTARAAWGRYWQSQRLTELPVEDGVTRFDEPQRADHWLLGIEHRRGRVAMRAEAYAKEFDRLRPRYENVFNPVELFPEALPDRIKIEPDGGSARGLEVMLKSDGWGRVSWWAGYSLSRAVDEIDGRDVPRSWDQRHATTFGLNLSLPRGWNTNLGGTWHTGWPTTAVSGRVEPDDPEEVELIHGPRNGERFPSYLRFDLRVSRRVETRWGRMVATLDVANVTNRENVCCVGDFETEIREDGSVVVVPEQVSWGPILPSLSLRWEF